MKSQQSPGAPLFSLKNVQDFSLMQSRPTEDVYLDRVDQKFI